MNEIIPKKDIPQHVHNEYDEDLDLVRKTLRSLLMSGEEGLQLAQRVAEESEHPRAIEVLTGMIKQQSENAGKLMDMHKKHKDINTTTSETTSKQPVNNNLIISDTSDFLKRLENMDKVIEEDV